MCARVALEVKALLEELGLRGWPKTSGSRGMHVNVRIEPRWTFTEVRRAALALSRAVERRVPALASSKWWKEERHGVFLDYNQNAKDRTTCSAYSVRPLPTRASPRRFTGTKFPTASRPISPCSPFRSASRSWAIPTRGWTRRRARSNDCWNWPPETRPRAWATRPGRRTFARWRAKRRASRLRAPNRRSGKPQPSAADEDAAARGRQLSG